MAKIVSIPPFFLDAIRDEHPEKAVILEMLKSLVKRIPLRITADLSNGALDGNFDGSITIRGDDQKVTEIARLFEKQLTLLVRSR